MKHKLKRILKLNIFVLGMLIVLTNCQTEDLVLKNESITKSKALVTKLNYEQFLRQQNVKSTVEKLKKIELTKISNSKNRNNTQRAIVTIDSSSINQVIKSGVVSYTFKVINSDLEANTFENLVIQTDTSQQTNAYLIKYTPSIILGMGIPFEGIKEITPLDSNTTINTTNKTTVCVSITTYTNYYLCDEGVVQSPETCDYQYTTESTETSCETLSDGAGGNSDSIVFYSNEGGGGGSPTPDSDYDGSDTNIHGNGGTPINTAPLFDEEGISDDPCTSIKKNTTNKSDYMENFNDLNVPAKYKYPYEAGFALRIGNTGIPNYSYLTPSPAGTSLVIPTGSLNYTHIHNNNIKLIEGDSLDVTVKMLSPADLWTLIKNCQTACTNNGASATDAFGVMVSNEGIFAISMLESFSPNGPDFNEKWFKFVRNYKEKSKEIIHFARANNSAVAVSTRIKKIRIR